MAAIMTREHISTYTLDSGPDYIHQKPKEDLQSHQFSEAKVYRLWLKISGLTCASIMQLISNDFEVTKYNGYNTNIAGKFSQILQPRTYVTYFSLINMNLAEPDTILTTMHMVKAATENYIQTYTIFTNNEQLSNITTQMTWLRPTVWENFYPV